MQRHEVVLNKRVVLQTAHGYTGTITGLRGDEFRVTFDGSGRPKRAPAGTRRVYGGRYWYPMTETHMFIDIKDAIAEVLAAVQGDTE